MRQIQRHLTSVVLRSSWQPFLLLVSKQLVRNIPQHVDEPLFFCKRSLSSTKTATYLCDLLPAGDQIPSPTVLLCTGEHHALADLLDVAYLGVFEFCSWTELTLHPNPHSIWVESFVSEKILRSNHLDSLVADPIRRVSGRHCMSQVRYALR